MDERTPDEEKKPGRLWDDSEEDAEVFSLPPLLGEDDEAVVEDADEAEAAAKAGGTAPTGGGAETFESMSLPQDLDDYGMNQYTGSTTHEYQGLAEEVSRAAEAEWEQQAVAATVPGVDSGLVGFEDVTGSRGDSEEDFEASEQAATSDLAMTDLSEVIRLDPGHAGAYGQRALLWDRKKEYAKSIVDATQAIRLDPMRVDTSSSLVAAGFFVTYRSARRAA